MNSPLRTGRSNLLAALKPTDLLRAHSDPSRSSSTKQCPCVKTDRLAAILSFPSLTRWSLSLSFGDPLLHRPPHLHMHTEQRRSDGTSIITLSAIRHRKLDRSPDTRCCVVHRPGIGVRILCLSMIDACGAAAPIAQILEALLTLYSLLTVVGALSGLQPHKLHVQRPSYSTVFTPDQFFGGDQIQLLQHQKLTCALYLNKNQVTLAAHFQMTA